MAIANQITQAYQYGSRQSLPLPVAAQITGACAVMRTIQAAAMSEVIGVYLRLEAARRTVQLLKGAAFSAALPVFPNLPAILSLSENAYNTIRLACPQLALPFFDPYSIAPIKKLDWIRQKYQSAVQSALDKMESYPIAAIDRLESLIQQELNKLFEKLGPFNQFITCVCAGAETLQDAGNIETAKSMYKELVQKPSLIGDELSGKMNTFRETRGQLRNVLSPRSY